MSQIITGIDWSQLILTVWTVVVLPLLTYAGTELRHWFKSKRTDKYTDILERNVLNAVKDVYETVVKDIKGTENWTDFKKEQVRELAKQKAVQALSNSAYECLKAANGDFDAYLDSLVGTALFDIKNK
ncbi:MAG: hypothetical protein ACI39R_06935 [Lachnospiraceae bacterium]